MNLTDRESAPGKQINLFIILFSAYSVPGSTLDTEETQVNSSVLMEFTASCRAIVETEQTSSSN